MPAGQLIGQQVAISEQVNQFVNNTQDRSVHHGLETNWFNIFTNMNFFRFCIKFFSSVWFFSFVHTCYPTNFEASSLKVEEALFNYHLSVITHTIFGALSEKTCRAHPTKLSFKINQKWIWFSHFSKHADETPFTHCTPLWLGKVFFQKLVGWKKKSRARW